MNHILLDSLNVVKPRPFPTYQAAEWMARSMNATVGVEYALQMDRERFYVMSLDEVMG